VSTRDDDILDFDFFDEEESVTWEDSGDEEPEPERRRGPRGPRPPRLRAPGNLTPLLRLVGLIALAILVVVLLVVWVQGCAADKKQTRYSNYMTEIGTIGAASAKLGDDLATLLTTPGLTQADLQTKLGGYVQLAEGQLQKANELHSPGPLHDANDGAIEALEFRVLGLKGLQTTFKNTANASDATTAGQDLSEQAQRLIASDVVWADRFQAVADAVMHNEGVEGIKAPPSQFVTTQDLATAKNLAAVWTRIQGASTGGTPTGLHGTGISYVKALPSGQLLSTTTQTTIKVTEQLAFEVGVLDTGDNQEVQIKVTLTIPKQPNNIVKTSTIPIIDAGEVKSVTFPIGTLVPFGEQLSVKVEVAPVKGETNLQNNSADYPVIFTL